MTAFRVLGTGVITVLAVTTAVVAAPQRGVNGEPGARAALARFDAAVGDYLRTHRFPDPVDLETLCLPEAAAHTSTARIDEPPPLGEGNVFTPDLVALIHARIVALALPAHMAQPRGHAVVVGDRLVPGRSARPPKAVIGVLPPILDDLDYRLAGNDLVLVDLRTNVIVDAIRDWRER
jgi:hypothetical protein